MANTITKQTLNDGERNLTVKVTIAGDNSGDESSTLLIDMSTYSGSFTDLAIKRIWSSLSGFSATLEWDATSNVDILTCVDGETFLDFEDVGYAINTKATGWTGDIAITTSGLGTEDGTIILEMVKRGITN